MKIPEDANINNIVRTKRRLKHDNASKRRKSAANNIQEYLNPTENDIVREDNNDSNIIYIKTNIENEESNSDDEISEDLDVSGRILKSRMNKLKKKKYKNKPTLKVSKLKASAVIKLLQEQKTKTKKFNKSCKFQMVKPISSGKEHGWDSFAHLLKHIQYCILNQEWHNLPDLILLLLRHPGQAMKLFKNYIKEMSYLNFLVNSEGSNADLLDQFYQQVFATIPAKKMKDLEVWYKDE